MSRLLLHALLGLLFSSLISVHAAEPVRLGTNDTYSLSGHMELLEDASAQWTLQDILRSSSWAPLPGEFNAGFSRSAFWLRFDVEQEPSQHATWRLKIGNPLLQDVRLYSRVLGGEWQEEKAGLNVPRQAWPLATRTPTFRVNLPPGRHTLYLRVAGIHSIGTQIHLQTSNQFYTESHRWALGFGAFFGMFAIVIVFQLFMWALARERDSRWYVLYSVTLMFGALVTTGLAQQAFGWSAVRTYQVGAALAFFIPIIFTKLTTVVLELDRLMPTLCRRFVQVVVVLALINASIIGAGNYGLGTAVNQILALGSMMLSIGLALVLLGRGHKHAVVYLLAFGIIDLSVITRFLRSLGYLEPGFFTENALYLGTALHLLVLNLFFIYRYNHLKRSLQIEQMARKIQKDFVSMVSHEVRTPLAIINTSVQQLAANLDAPAEKNQQRCQNIRAAVQRMDLLLEDYLSLDRLSSAYQPLRLRPCDLHDIIPDAAAEWQHRRIEIRVQDLPSRFVCDVDLMRIVLRNLLANAIRHSPADSVIDLEAQGTRRGGLGIRIQDRGEGISAEEMPHLFQKYFRGRTSKGHPGAGLGLYLVHKIIQAHGGTVEVQSTVGQGTVFGIHLPPAGRAMANAQRALIA